MKKIILMITIVAAVKPGFAQDKYFTKTAKIHFDATAPASPENITAINKSATCVLDTKTGNLQFSVLVKGFEFERALMQEHFNENYMESTTYTKAEFKGAIGNNAAVNYSKDGDYTVKVSGKLTMHGVTKDIQADGSISVKSGKIGANAAFTVQLKDYNISIPSMVADKVSPTAKITVDCMLDPLKQ